MVEIFEVVCVIREQKFPAKKKKKGKKEEEERKKKRQYSPANSSCMEVERFQKIIVKYVTFCTQIAFFPCFKNFMINRENLVEGTTHQIWRLPIKSGGVECQQLVLLVFIPYPVDSVQPGPES